MCMETDGMGWDRVSQVVAANLQSLIKRLQFGRQPRGSRSYIMMRHPSGIPCLRVIHTLRRVLDKGVRNVASHQASCKTTYCKAIHRLPGLITLARRSVPPPAAGVPVRACMWMEMERTGRERGKIVDIHALRNKAGQFSSPKPRTRPGTDRGQEQYLTQVRRGRGSRQMKRGAEGVPRSRCFSVAWDIYLRAYLSVLHACIHGPWGVLASAWPGFYGVFHTPGSWPVGPASRGRIDAC